MKKHKLLIATALFGLSAISNAAILASGPIYAGNTQNFGRCNLFNASNVAITVSSVQIFDQNSTTPVELGFNNCSGQSLAPNATCFVMSVVVTGGGNHYSCRTVTSTATGIRGSFELRDLANDLLLQRVDLR